MAFALGGSASARIQHTGQVISLAYLPLALWLLARALERSSWRAGLAAGALGGLMALGRDQVALLSLYVLAGFVLAYWVAGEQPLARLRASIKPLGAAAVSGSLVAAVPIIMTALLAARSNRPEIAYASAAGRLDPPRASAATRRLPISSAPWIRTSTIGRRQSPIWDAAWGSPGLYLSQNMGLVYAGALPFVACRVVRPHPRRRLGARDPVLHHRGGARAALCARRLYAGLPPDVRPAARGGALSPPGRCDLRAGRAGRGDRRLSRPSLAHRHRAAGDARCSARSRSPARSPWSPPRWRLPHSVVGVRLALVPVVDRDRASRRRRSRCWCWRAGSRLRAGRSPPRA